MSDTMTKSQARNIFYAGSLAFLVIFVGLTVHSHLYIVNTSTDSEGLTETVERGKRIWEKNACINCHTLLLSILGNYAARSAPARVEQMMVTPRRLDAQAGPCGGRQGPVFQRQLLQERVAGLGMGDARGPGAAAEAYDAERRKNGAPLFEAPH